MADHWAPECKEIEIGVEGCGGKLKAPVLWPQKAAWTAVGDWTQEVRQCRMGTVGRCGQLTAHAPGAERAAGVEHYTQDGKEIQMGLGVGGRLLKA